MARYTLLIAFCVFLGVYAWRDWYKSLCGLILMMAVIEHPDMPKSMFGAQGLNPWNIILFVIILAWLSTRRKEGLVWDMPTGTNILLILYSLVIMVAFFRMMTDTDELYTFAYFYGSDPPTTDRID